MSPAAKPGKGEEADGRPGNLPLRALSIVLGLHGLVDILVIFAAKKEFLAGLIPPTTAEYIFTGFETSAKLLVAALLWEENPKAYLMLFLLVMYAVTAGTVSVLLFPPDRSPLLLWGIGTLYYALMLNAGDSRPVRARLLGPKAPSMRAVAVAKRALLMAALAALIIKF